jgi:hypothetical protein
MLDGTDVSWATNLSSGTLPLASMGVESRIVAMGGGGFSMEPDNPLLDNFVLALARHSPPRVCFVPTASADAAEYVVKFYRAFTSRSCIPTDVTFFDSPALPRQPASADASPDL